MNNNNATYRPDIDGLRAVAVISVVIYHAFPSLLKGGFVGVDIFFVISGYLITSHILGELKTGTFTFASFYGRRAKRIFPALITVLIACALIGYFVLMPDDFRKLGKHIVSGAAFVSNFTLWSEAGYFDDASNTKPLLHLWSLAVEEQFYILWPLLLFTAWRIRAGVIILIVAVIALSFSYNVINVRANGITVFYLLPGRAWELLAGALLAYLQQTASGIQPQKAVAAFLSIAGALFLVCAIFLTKKNYAFPGWWAVLPIIGAACVIVVGPSAPLNRTLLSNKWMVRIGLISYPLYLWHWPLLTFSEMMNWKVSTVIVRVVALMLSVALAILTYRLIERPLRFQIQYRFKTALLCVTVACLGAIGLAISNYSITNGRPAMVKYLSYFEKYREIHKGEMIEQYGEGCSFHTDEGLRDSIDRHCYEPHGRPVVMLFGDSHAQQLRYGLQQILPSDVSLIQITTTGCKPADKVEEKKQTLHCQRSTAFGLQKIKEIKPDILILAQVVQHEKTNWEELAASLKNTGAKNIVVVGPVPQWKPFLYKALAITGQYEQGNVVGRLAGFAYPGNRETEIMMKKNFTHPKNFTYVSVMDTMCNGDGCISYWKDPKQGITSFDYGHLTPLASKYVASNAIGPIVLPMLSK